MSKIKIHELAKELSVESKDVMKALQKLGYEVKSHMSTIDDSLADKVRQSAPPNTSKGKASVDEVNRGFVPKVTRIPKSAIPVESSESDNSGGDAVKPLKVDAPENSLKAGSELKSEAKTDTPKATENTNAVMPEKTVNPQAARVDKSDPISPSLTAKKEEKTVMSENSPIEKKSEKPAYANEQQRDYSQDQNRPPRQPYQGQGGGTQNQQGNRPPRPGYQGQGGGTQNQQGNRPPRPPYQGQGGGTQNQQGNRPPRPPYQGQGGGTQNQQGNRPPRPPYQGQGGGTQNQQGNRPPRPPYQGQGGGTQNQQGNRPPRPPYQGQGGGTQNQQGNRPPYQGQGGGYNSGYNKDKADDSKAKFDKNKPQPKAAAGKPKGAVASAIEKPTSHRPTKKVFTKDIKQERVSRDESGRPKKDYRPGKGPKGKNFKGKKELKKEMPPVMPKKIIIGEHVVLGELAKSMGKTAAEIIKKLFELGIMATINQEIDSETAILVASEFGVTVEVKADKSAEIMGDIDDDERDLRERPPVVAVMGHVDHGKTSLLDAIRKTNVTATEAGGITQHIGAYQVEVKGKKITFLDTPGHEAFTAMRARGAQITDISILVVAADDGVMPQTIEAINHSKAAGVPIITAINKMDKPGANSSRIQQELMEHGLLSEEWGGEAIMVPISAKKGEGIDNLLEMILLLSEVAELKANPKRKARGTVIESQLDKARGPVATLLVQKGTLRVGDNIIAGAVFGKVRAMNDEKGRMVRVAGPSTPVEVLGFSEAPPAGEVFMSVKEDRDARMAAEQQQIKKREVELRKSSRVSLDDLFKQIAEGEIKELNLIIKADVHGSIEALQHALNNLNTDEVKINIIHKGVGGINDSDIMLASASNAIVIGFNVRPDVNARKSAEHENVDIRLYRVIYDATEDVKKAMSGLLAPEFKENIIGHAEIRSVFKVPKAGMVAGSYVTEGKITRNAQVRLIRDSIVIFETKIESLKRFKDDVKEVQTGFECGIGFENYNDIKEGDVIEAYIMEEFKREL